MEETKSSALAHLPLPRLKVREVVVAEDMLQHLRQ
jgi:hypothetical protein